MSSDLFNEWQKIELPKHLTDDFNLELLLQSTMGGPLLTRGPSQLGIFAHSNKSPLEMPDRHHKPKMGG